MNSALHRLAGYPRLAPSRPRLPIATRAGLSMFAVVAAGWAANDLTAGLMATLGVFTALYLPDRPYFNRAVMLAGIALGLAICVMAGLATKAHGWAAVPVVSLLATIATFLFTALRIGPPGSYMLVLACAAGTALPQNHLGLWRISGLVLAGGAFAWAVQMAGAMVAPRGPERTAFVAAAVAVARFTEAPDQTQLRHAAATALNEAWASLVSQQPTFLPPGKVLSFLRAANRELHQIFAACIAGEMPPGAAQRARALAQAARNVREAALPEPPAGPLGHPGVIAALRESFRAWSPAAHTAARTGLACFLAGLLGAAFGLERSYWAMAAAVLVLNQGLGFSRSLQRGRDRMLGTLLGLCFVWLLSGLHPWGLWLAALMAALQFVTEMLVPRNYAMAVVFITAIALCVASDGYAEPHLTTLLLARGEDTILGCLVAFAVHALLARHSAEAPLRASLEASWRAALPVLTALEEGSVTSPAARRARQALQHRLFGLAASFEVDKGGLAAARQAAAALAGQVEATQRLGYRLLAACWLQEASSSRFGAAIAGEIAAELNRLLAGEEPHPASALDALTARLAGQ